MTHEAKLIFALTVVTSLMYLIGYWRTPIEDKRHEEDPYHIANDFDAT